MWHFIPPYKIKILSDIIKGQHFYDINIAYFFHRCPDVQNSGQGFHFAQSDKCRDAQEAIVFEQDGRSARIALLHLGGSDEIVAVKAGDYAFGRRQAIFGTDAGIAEHDNFVAQRRFLRAEGREVGGEVFEIIAGIVDVDITQIISLGRTSYVGRRQ